MDTNSVAPLVDVGGSSYTVLYKPNLSRSAREEINEKISKSSSGDSTDIYEVDTVQEALTDGRLNVSEQDKNVLNAITQGYIEI